MEWRIKWLDIENFKSIKKARFDCKRVNIFVGPPNVGKSNLLEAVGMLGAYNTNRERLFSDYVRYERFNNIFNYGEIANTVQVNSNLGYFFCDYPRSSKGIFNSVFGSDIKELDEYKSMRDKASFVVLDSILGKIMNEKENRGGFSPAEHLVKNKHFHIKENGMGARVAPNLTGIGFEGHIKKYDFVKNREIGKKQSIFLEPPYGENIFSLLDFHSDIAKEVSEIFEQYGLKLYFDSETRRIEIVRTMDNRLYKTPYSLCADTLQRYIFHLLAIKTNFNSVLILEEPESHCFPKFISELSVEMIEDNANQYFIATHSPYLLTKFIERCESDELALFICGFKDYNTTIRELSRKEIGQIKDEGVDLFYNIEAFEHD